jgi:hypothetical protein
MAAAMAGRRFNMKGSFRVADAGCVLPRSISLFAACPRKVTVSFPTVLLGVTCLSPTAQGTQLREFRHTCL